MFQKLPQGVSAYINTLRHRKVFQSICFSATLWQLWPLFLVTVRLVLGELGLFFPTVYLPGLELAFVWGLTRMTLQVALPAGVPGRFTLVITFPMTDTRVYYPVVYLAPHYLTLPSPLLVFARSRREPLGS